ncbi:MAG TPA: RNA polymerase factor sigma-54 [Bacteroidales bacterium]|nr:RNA polymerase factor sigma-54 [Bacteroidales bacterium]HOL98225.1 RNA polymerase factor sigma-54 [Bacteroidales bacterium]HOM36448.1 RNA polymerase factor sigma-54 [Bacteroidales bacterium]HUM32608.1 RNA polymerase factor sigma-54 [Bacteroidales bacterium]
MLKPGLQQKLLQKLSPQQIQMIKLLELPTVQLEERIKKELEENPALDEGPDDSEDGNFQDNLTNEEEDNSADNSEDEFSIEDYLQDEDDEIPAYKLQANNYSKDDEHKEIPYSAAKTFHEFLQEQLILKDLTEKEKIIAEYLIGNIDEDGYLRREIENIVDDIAFSANIDATEQEILNVLEIIQELDPPGVGAQNLQECLLIQLERKEEQTPAVENAKRIIVDCFEEFTKKHYHKIKSKCDLEDEDLKEAIDIIIKLNPKPGSSFGEPQTRSFNAIIPDFILEIENNKVIVSLNSRNTPELRISKMFSQMLEEYSSSKNKNNKEAIAFIKQKIDSAKWFIDAINQRQNTLLFTMNAIAEFQKEFFLTGDETKLKPMILKDIAEITGLDISTISRVANSKYVATPYGNFPLKYFFSEGMQTETGEEVSTREIKQILKECIEKENKSKPLTDDKLAEILKSKGYIIARRTVAKYREQLGIPVARLRKELL